MQNNNIVELLTEANYTEIVPTEPRLVLRYSCYCDGHFDGSFGYQITINDSEVYSTHDKLPDNHNRYKLIVPISVDYDYVTVTVKDNSTDIPKNGYWSTVSNAAFYCNFTFNENEIISIGGANSSLDYLYVYIAFYKY